MTVLPSDEAAETPYLHSRQPALRPARAAPSSMTIVSPWFDSFGDIGATSGRPDGIYFNDTRFLSRLEMSLNRHATAAGSAPTSATTTRWLSVDLTNPDIYSEKRGCCSPKDTIHIVVVPYSSGGARPISGSRCAITASVPSGSTCR